jgi:hypothetical protein
MSNTITIELCAEDRARLDKIIEGLASTPRCDHGAKAVAETVAGITQSATEPQEAPKEEPKAETNPAEEAPQESTQDPEDSALAEKVEPTVTLEQIQQKVVQLAASGAEKKAKVREVISAYGTKVSDLKDQPEKWGEVWEKLTALEG